MDAIIIPTTGALGSIPAAWPSLLTREQVCAYVGMAVDTFNRLCPVAPLALGARILRWRRADIDEWVAGLPQRATSPEGEGAGGRGLSISPTYSPGDERRFSAIERAKARAAGKRVPARGR